MRIDRLLCELNIGSRSQVKELLKRGLVSVDGVIVKKADIQVDEQKVSVLCQGKEYRYQPFVYFMMNKPAGVITATKDEREQTVLELFKEQYHFAEPLRSVGLRAINLKDDCPAQQIDIFGESEADKKTEQVEDSLYKVRQKFGKNSIKRGRII